MKKFFPLLLTGILLLLSLSQAACSSPGQKEDGGQGAPAAQNGSREETAMGRYRETPVPFPVPAKHIFDIEKGDGALRVLSEQEPGDFTCCKSTDGGATWEQEPWDTSWMPEGYRAVSACFAPEGAVFVSAGKMSDDPIDEKHAAGSYVYFRLAETESGWQASQLSLALPEPKEEYLNGGYGLTSMACGEDGSLYGILNYRLGEENHFQIFSFNPDTGAANWEREIQFGEIQMYGDTLCLSEYDGRFQILDKASGETLSEITSPSGNVYFRLMDMDMEEKKIFYCQETGIYGADDAMALTELLVDGRLSSFSDISKTMAYFCSADEKTFLLFLKNDASQSLELMRYSYDATLATQPGQELKIYSLDSDDIVKKLVSNFQASHPDVLVTYETGMDGSNAKSESDAINILNTEIMAGNGPDLLFLNGLPWKSYAGKGILADISSLGPCQEGTVFENLFSAYGTKDGQYVAPIAFSIPALAGEESQIANIHSLEGLAELAKNTDGLPSLGAYNFLPYLFTTFWQEILTEDGTVSKEAVKEFFSLAKELEDSANAAEASYHYLTPFQTADDGQAASYAFFTPFLDVWNVIYGNVAASTGYLGSALEFTAVSGHIPGQKLAARPFPEHVFTALAAGINSKSGQAALAREFLEFALSEKGQAMLIDGSLPAYTQFPVNKAVWESMVKEPSPEQVQHYADMFQKLGGSYRWPAQEEFGKLEQAVSGLTTPAMDDLVIIRTVLDGGASYLSGGKSLDGAVDEVVQKLELYLKE